MSREIKTRKVQKNIKLLDKSAVAAQHIKKAEHQLKERTEREEKSQVSPVLYGQEKVAGVTERGALASAYAVKKGGVYAARAAKGKTEKIRQYMGRKAAERRAKEGIRAEKQTTREQAARVNTVVKIKERSYGGKLSGDTVKKFDQAAVEAARITAKKQTFRKWAEKRDFHGIRNVKEAVRTLGKATVHVAKTAATGVQTIAVTLGTGGFAALFLILFVVFGVSFGTGSNQGTATATVSEEVEAYDGLIRQYAQKYGISEYVELIKAVMMQESGGKGSDPMQSSEGPFNKKYPRRPNGISDPEYSIECGVQELKSCLEQAGAAGAADLGNIKLALQGYNFGNGYISWAKQKYGGYSLSNAAEFSNMMAKDLGWHRYGDKQYVPHVLRYYSVTSVFGGIGFGSQDIVNSALSQVGNVGGARYWRWYGFHSRVSWCACFVSWNAEQCGYIQKGIIPKYASCQAGANWFREKGRWRNRDYLPSPGDIIFFDWNGSGVTHHTGIVEKCQNGVVYTIEGNSSNRVRKRTYAVGYKKIYGYGVLEYGK